MVEAQFLTLPHDDLAFSVAAFGLISAANSSANPHEQSLHAFRLPVVPQTKNHIHIFYKIVSQISFSYPLPLKSVGSGFTLSSSSSKSSSLMRSSSSVSFQTAAAAFFVVSFLANDNLVADPTSYFGFSATISRILIQLLCENDQISCRILPFPLVLMFTNPANFKFSEICSAFLGDTRRRPLCFSNFNNDAKNGMSEPSLDFTITNVNVESPYDAEMIQFPVEISLRCYDSCKVLIVPRNRILPSDKR